MAARASPRDGAVWRASRTRHERSASNTTSATASVRPRPRHGRASSSWCSTSALMPRAPHLQSYASAAPSRSTVTSYGCISADAVEQDRAARGGRRRRRPGARAAAGERLDDRAAELAADLLAAVGDLEATPRGSPRTGSRSAAGRRSAPKSVGNIVRHAPGRCVSPFITARASTRCAGVASASSVGGARDQRVGLDPRVDDGPAVAAASWNLTAARAEASRTTCGKVDSQSIARCGSLIGAISAIAASTARRGGIGRRRIGAVASATASRRVAPGRRRGR